MCSRTEARIFNKKVVDSSTRRNILLVIYHAGRDTPNYGIMMKRVKAIQEMLEEKHNISLGYQFHDEHIYNVWDNRLLEDLEILDLEGLIDNEDREYQEIIYTHDLHKATWSGEFFLEKSIKPLLEELSKGLFQDITRTVEVMSAPEGGNRFD